MAWQGEAAGLLTSVCWTGSSIAFTLAGRRVGSVVVNHVRLWMALVVICGLHWAVFGNPFPYGSAGSSRLMWLGLSGLIGYTIGDSLLFEAFVRVGPRLSMLMMTLSPIFAALLAWVFLGESLTPMKVAGIAVTLSGIAMVIIETGGADSRSKSGKNVVGILLGAGSGFCQAAALLLSKIGMHGGYSAFSANLIRLTAASITVSLIAAMRKELLGDVRRMTADRPALGHTFAATLLGPVIGVLLMLYSITHTYVGVASTLMSLSPVLLLPISHAMFGEKIRWPAVLGTFISMAGVVLLF
jgi:drug/metabolite transporter (DMT)-like permease